MKVVVKRSRRRTISIKILNSGEVQVNCPLRYSDNQVNKILEEKEEWIQKGIAKVQQRYSEHKEFYNYSKIMFLGTTYEIKYVENNIQIGDYLIPYRKGSSAQNVIKKWLLKMAKSLILPRISHLSEYCDLRYKSTKIISARKKWGSCNSEKEIRLNFRMIMLSQSCIDYVCIHELCHLKYMNHSKYFWSLVQKHLSNYRQIKKEISQNNFVLDLF